MDQRPVTSSRKDVFDLVAKDWFLDWKEKEKSLFKLVASLALRTGSTRNCGDKDEWKLLLNTGPPMQPLRLA